MKKMRTKKISPHNIQDIQMGGVIYSGWINTKFGKLRVKWAGEKKRNNLILFIHGSGLKNSVETYVPLIKRLYEKEKEKKYFYVSFDCPGYGESKTGKRQSIRTYPVEVIQAVYKELGFKKAKALYGHSQGCSVIFNACILNQSLCDVLIQDGAVFAISKLRQVSKIKQPVLLVSDVDDIGHPFAISKLISKRLEAVNFITYSSKKTNKKKGYCHHTQQPWWLKNFAGIMVDFLSNPSKSCESYKGKK